MSYSRFGPDSDVYLFMTEGDRLHCCWCKLLSLPGNCEDFVAVKHRDMIEHLRKHEEAGHKVPAEAIERLEREAEEPASTRSQ